MFRGSLLQLSLMGNQQKEHMLQVHWWGIDRVLLTSQNYQSKSSVLCVSVRLCVCQNRRPQGFRGTASKTTHIMEISTFQRFQKGKLLGDPSPSTSPPHLTDPIRAEPMACPSCKLFRTNMNWAPERRSPAARPTCPPGNWPWGTKPPATPRKRDRGLVGMRC